ncbi:hypothetical protein EOPP23_18505 [Endozoicomonas sp. OPT23]|uniref:hypothetical protein n=1 Tax=Endozoicomonas sp. OPT23 TaxID=2072845 RepID=UPI00129BBF37|nr:hypothetical protein [Endozoicomonas sp. OPT23]MRI34971.1 hypothetical protein [Endozoicomonas sp. OPT23]
MSTYQQALQDIVKGLEISRVCYEMPDTSAVVRYCARFDDDQPEELTVHSSWGDPAVNARKTGSFSLKELVNELRYAYVLVHVFAEEAHMDYYLAGMDAGLAQLEFIGGNFDFERMWVTRGISNLELPIAIFLGQRHAVNAQPSVTLVDHRQKAMGEVAYRAVRGAGEHVGEEFYNQD